MTINVNDMQNAQAHFLTENLVDESKEITEKHTSTAGDSAKDSIAPQMDVNQNRLEVARDSIEAASAILGIAEKGAQIVLDMAQKMEETRAKAASGEISDNERILLDQHFQLFKAQFERTVANTKYGDKNLLDGSLSAGSTVETNTVGIEPGAAAAPTATSYEIDMAGKSSAVDIANALANAINTADRATLFADKDFNVQTAANAERLAEIMDEIIAKAIAANAALDKFNDDTAVDSLGLNSTLFSTDHAFAAADDWHLI